MATEQRRGGEEAGRLKRNYIRGIPSSSAWHTYIRTNVLYATRRAQSATHFCKARSLCVGPRVCVFTSGDN